MMNRTELNENMMAQVNGGDFMDYSTESVLREKKCMDRDGISYFLMSPDGKEYSSDGHLHMVAQEFE